MPSEGGTLQSLYGESQGKKSSQMTQRLVVTGALFFLQSLFCEVVATDEL